MDKLERIPWIDTTRGIAILLVVFGHCMGYIDNPINKVILSFHMPLFFFLSGCCAKKKNEDIGVFIKSRIRKLLPGQLFLAATCIMYDFLAIRKLSIVSNLFIWFLPVLFYTEILFQITTDRTRLVILGIAAVMVLMLTQNKINTIVHLEVTPMAFIFYVAGYYIIGEGATRITKATPMIALLISVPVLLACALCNEPVLMYENTYGRLFFFFPSAIMGILTACVLGNVFENNKLLTWVGQKSLLIYVLHFKLTGIIHYCFKHTAGMNLDLYNSPYYYAVFFLEFLILYIMIRAIDRVCQLWSVYRK